MEVFAPGPGDMPVAPEVRAAIAAFLNEYQKEARPFATAQVLEAVRNVFPGLDISDPDLEDAISNEAHDAGFDIDFDSRDGPRNIKRKALERWDNEGNNWAVRKKKPETNAAPGLCRK